MRGNSGYEERSSAPAIALALVLVLVGLLGIGAYFVVGPGAGGTSSQDELEQQEQAQVLEAKSFTDYTWSELSQIAQMISAADSDEAGRQIAQQYNLVTSAGTLTTEEHDVVTSDNVLAKARLVGIRADEKFDGSGKAGLTLMVTTVTRRVMNQTDTCDGGWAASDMRTWFASDGMSLLPSDLVSVIVPVSKLSNNVGLTADSSSVNATSDSLWLFSASEVCGSLDWFNQEYAESYDLNADFYDELLSSEGEQYEGFSQAGITCAREAYDYLTLTYGGASGGWWLRTAYPFDYLGNDHGCFYQVMKNGLVSTVGQASTSQGVVIGLCL